MTKELVDQWALRMLIGEGVFETQYSSLSEGRLLEAHKGLPPPKSAKVKDEASYQFLLLFHEADEKLRELLVCGLALPDGPM